MKNQIQKFTNYSPYLKRYFILSSLNSGFFQAATWYFFLLSRGLSAKQIAVILTIELLLGFILDIPLGVLADKFSSKTIMIYGHFLAVVSTGLLFIANSFWVFILASILSGIYLSSISGANEDLALSIIETEQPELSAKEKNKSFTSILSQKATYAEAFQLIAIPIGGLLGKVHLFIPSMLWGLSQGIGLVVLLGIKLKTNAHVDEVEVLEIEEEELEVETKKNFNHFFEIYITVLLLGGILRSFYWGSFYVEFLRYNTYSFFIIGLILSFSGLLTIYFLHHLQRISSVDIRILSLGISTLLVIASFKLPLINWLVFSIIVAMYPVFFAIVNANIGALAKRKKRVTMLSLGSWFSSLTVLGMFFITAFAVENDWFDSLLKFLPVFPLVVVVAVTVSRRFQK